MYICIYVYMYICIYIYIDVYVCMYVCIYICLARKGFWTLKLLRAQAGDTTSGIMMEAGWHKVIPATVKQHLSNGCDRGVLAWVGWSTLIWSFKIHVMFSGHYGHHLFVPIFWEETSCRARVFCCTCPNWGFREARPGAQEIKRWEWNRSDSWQMSFGSWTLFEDCIITLVTPQKKWNITYRWDLLCIQREGM